MEDNIYIYSMILWENHRPLTPGSRIKCTCSKRGRATLSIREKRLQYRSRSQIKMNSLRTSTRLNVQKRKCLHGRHAVRNSYHQQCPAGTMWVTLEPMPLRPWCYHNRNSNEQQQYASHKIQHKCVDHLYWIILNFRLWVWIAELHSFKWFTCFNSFQSLNTFRIFALGLQKGIWIAARFRFHGTFVWPQSLWDEMLEDWC